MKVTVVGYRPYSFNGKSDGREVSGISLYVTHADPTQEDLRGHTIAKYSIRGGSELYHRLLGHQFVKPFEADADLIVSNNRANLMDLRFGAEK